MDKLAALFISLALLCQPCKAQPTSPQWLTWDTVRQTTAPTGALSAIEAPLAVLLSASDDNTHISINGQSHKLADLSVQTDHTSVLLLLPEHIQPQAALSLTLAASAPDITGLPPLLGNYTALQSIKQQREMLYWQLPAWVAMVSAFTALVLLLALSQQLRKTSYLALIGGNLFACLLLVYQLANTGNLLSLGVGVVVTWLCLQMALSLATFHFLVSQYVATQKQLKELNVTLDHRVQLASEELAQRYARVKADSLNAAGLRERKSIFHSVHEDLSDKLLQLIYTAPLADIEDLARSALNDLRETRNLQTDTQQNLEELVAVLHIETETRCEQAGIRLSWRVAGNLNDCYLTAPERSCITRTLREALSNVLKHARATETHIQIDISDTQQLVYSVSDNGGGIRSSVHSGRGLLNMHSRIRDLGGDLTVSAIQSGGTKLVFTLPLSGLESRELPT